MTNLRKSFVAPAAHRAGGFTLVELMVAMALGLVLMVGVASAYLFTKTAFTRQAQLSSIQQGVRTAFEYLGGDARMVGHLGCFTNSPSNPTNDLVSGALPATVATNYALGIEGYEFDNTTAGAYTISADSPADITDPSKWRTNLTGLTTVPLAALGGGLTPGSDVLVIRTVVGKPIRLTANTSSAGDSLAIENIAGGTCSDGTTAMVSGFCPGSHGLIASCSAARVFSVNTVAGSTLTPVAGAAGAYPVYAQATAEVFPMQTVAYYVKRSSNNRSTSLYRRVFNGDPVAGVESELIEGVESMQLRFGRDTTVDPDGIIDDYKNAQDVTDWSRVVTIRMSLLLRSETAAAGDVALATTGRVNDVTVSYPTGSKFDRRVFTSTVAIRNKISYFPP